MGAPVEFRIRLDGARALVLGELAEIQLRVEESEFPSERPDAFGNECSVRSRAGRVEQGIIPGLVANRSVDDVPVGELSSERINDLPLPLEAQPVILSPKAEPSGERLGAEEGRPPRSCCVC